MSKDELRAARNARLKKTGARVISDKEHAKRQMDAGEEFDKDATKDEYNEECTKAAESVLNAAFLLHKNSNPATLKKVVADVLERALLMKS